MNFIIKLYIDHVMEPLKVRKHFTFIMHQINPSSTTITLNKSNNPSTIR